MRSRWHSPESWRRTIVARTGGRSRQDWRRFAAGKRRVLRAPRPYTHPADNDNSSNNNKLPCNSNNSGILVALEVLSWERLRVNCPHLCSVLWQCSVEKQNVVSYGSDHTIYWFLILVCVCFFFSMSSDRTSRVCSCCGVSHGNSFVRFFPNCVWYNRLAFISQHTPTRRPRTVCNLQIRDERGLARRAWAWNQWLKQIILLGERMDFRIM